MPTGTIAPFPKHQFFDNNGNPLSGGKLFVYTAGTSTKVNTYTDAALSVANANPIVLDSAGRCTIFLTPGVSYKFVMAPSTDTDPPTSPLWTVDNSLSVPSSNIDVDVAITAGENLTANDAVYLSQGDGGLTAGRWYKCDSGTDYKSVTAIATGFCVSTVAAGATGTARVQGRMTGFSSLIVGATYYVGTAGAITNSAPTNARRLGVADSTSTLILTASSPDATASNSGIVNTGTQTIAGAKTFSGAAAFSSATAAQFTQEPTFYPGGQSGNGFANASGRFPVTPMTTAANSGTAQTDLRSMTLKANTLNANNMTLRVSGRFTAAANANTKTLSFYVGTQQVVIEASTWGGVATSIWVEVDIVRTGAAAQSILVRTINNAGLAPVVSLTTGTQNLASDLTVKFTGQSDTASSDVTQNYFNVEMVG